MTVAESCSELALLAPMLGPALLRDNAAGGTATRWEATLSPVNTDVLSVMITLRHEIPAKTMHCCQIVNEPWQARSLSACLIALPRLDARMHNLSMGSNLEDICRRWVRVTKRALGLYEPGHPLQYEGRRVGCPACDDCDPPGQLTVGGYESFPYWDDPTRPPRKEWDARVYCSLYTGHQWQRGEWEHLELLLRYRHQQQVSA